MSEYALIQKDILTATGDVIREYTGKTKLYTLNEMENILEPKVAKLIQRNITSLTIPNGVTSIRPSAFSYCISLTSITIPNSVTSIGSNAFYYCRSLTFITIPNSVTSIGSNAFGACTNLKTINVPWSEGAVAGAPWGATNATINYNHMGE